jgi:hypothetical protein
MQFFTKPRFNQKIVLFWALSLLAPFVINAQNKKSSKAPEEKVVWGLEQINLDTTASGKTEGEQALAESFRYLRDKMQPEEQVEFKAWNINLHAADREKDINRNGKKTVKYLKTVEAASKYFVAIAFEWNKEHLVQDLDVYISLPDNVPAFQEFSKKQVAMMAKVIFKESLRSAGLMANPKK